MVLLWHHVRAGAVVCFASYVQHDGDVVVESVGVVFTRVHVVSQDAFGNDGSENIGNKIQY